MHLLNDTITIAVTLGLMSGDRWGPPMFKKLKECFKPLPPIEQWSLANADKCTPDQLVAATIIQSFAKHFEDWTFTGKFDQVYKPNRGDPNRFSAESVKKTKFPSEPTSLRNEKKDITIDVLFDRKELIDDNSYSMYYTFTANGCKVNGVKIDYECWKEIHRSWLSLVEQVRAAKQAAAEAKARMERNEQVWNLAENLLGMRRNEFGALVPIEPEQPKPKPKAVRLRSATTVKIC